MRAARLCVLLLLGSGCRQIFGLHGLDDDVDGGFEGNAITEGGANGFGGVVTGGEITARGIEPDVYAAGGLHAVAFNTLGVTTGTDLDKLDLGAPVGEVYGFTLGAQNHGLSLPNPDSYSLVLDGEIFLDAGVNQLEVSTHGTAVFEVTTGDDVARFETSDDDAIAPVTVATTGWYPIRGAFSTGPTLPSISFDVVQPGGVFAPFPLARLRARTTDAHGLLAIVADGVELETPLGTTIAPPFLNEVSPADFPVSGLYSMRFEGQFLVATDETTMHELDTNVGGLDIGRMFIDGAEVVDRWYFDGSIPEQTPFALTAGWHSIVVDFGHVSGTAHLNLGPEGSLVDTVRPMTSIETHVGTIASCSYGPFTLASCDVDMPEPVAGEVVDADLALTVSGSRHLTLSLTNAGASRALSLAAAPNEATDPASPFDYFPGDGRFAGTDASASWQVEVTEASDQGQLAGTLMTRSRFGVGQPVKDTVVYTSPEFALPAGKTLAKAGLDTDPIDTKIPVGVAFRTADTPAELANLAFTPVSGDIGAGFPMKALVQYQVTIRGDGWTFVTVKGVSLEFL